ncbi:fluoride efflux transporter CrcB [Neorhizobium galegae]|uniref:fluoride efflux transporter CrcB n=1 Tax=Neorhizobium galegae TaxID=399 RepID=UPI001AE4AE69|nr:fluoride efflux transporter CrcB [Neorhizobium galegae]
MMQLTLVAVGGAVGSVCRYLAGLAVTRLLGFNFPWGTLTINIAGCFAIGFLTELLARRFDASLDLRLLIIVGFLGGFTTFSSFSLDTMVLIERGATAAALAYVLASVLVSLLAAFGGLALGRAVL